MNKDGEMVYMDNYTKDEHIGAVGVHEARHVTDKESRGFQNKGKDVEKAPNSDQLKHYRELDEHKKQGQ